MKDEPFEDAVYKLLILLAREGIALGIHVVLTSGRQLNIRVALHSNIKTQFTLKQNDSSDVVSVVGTTKYRDMEDIKGRALFAREEVDPIQLFLPFENENILNMIQLIRKEAEKMSQYWTGYTPESIPMVPAVLTDADLKSRKGYREAIEHGDVVLGLDKESVTIRLWKRKNTNLLVLSNKQDHMSTIIQYVMGQIGPSEKKIVFAPEFNTMKYLADYEIISEKSAVEEMLEAMAYRITEKMKEQDDSSEVIIAFYDYATFVSSLSMTAVENLKFILEKGRLVGYTCFVATDPSITGKIDSASKLVRQTDLLLLDMRVVDQNVILPLNRNSREPMLEFQEQWIIENKTAYKIQVSYIGEIDE